MGKKNYKRSPGFGDLENEKLQNDNNKLRFSFEFYDTTTNEYCLSEMEKKDIKRTLERLKQVNEKSFKELLSEKRVFHFHEVDWKRTTEKNGFPDSRVSQLQPFQFSILGVKNQRARIFGAYYQGTFYIVWFDYEHKIYPSYRK